MKTITIPQTYTVPEDGGCDGCAHVRSMNIGGPHSRSRKFRCVVFRTELVAKADVEGSIVRSYDVEKCSQCNLACAAKPNSFERSNGVSALTDEEFINYLDQDDPVQKRCFDMLAGSKR